MYKTYNGSLFDYHSGCFCGVLINERIMKKLAALQAKHLTEVKRLLTDGADSNEVFSSMWTLHHPDGKQQSVTFIDTSADIKARVSSATHAQQPAFKPLVFIASSMAEAEAMANEHHAETKVE